MIPFQNWQHGGARIYYISARLPARRANNSHDDAKALENRPCQTLPGGWRSCDGTGRYRAFAHQFVRTARSEHYRCGNSYDFTTVNNEQWEMQRQHAIAHQNHGSPSLSRPSIRFSPAHFAATGARFSRLAVQAKFWVVSSVSSLQQQRRDGFVDRHQPPRPARSRVFGAVMR